MVLTAFASGRIRVRVPAVSLNTRSMEEVVTRLRENTCFECKEKDGVGVEMVCDGRENNIMEVRKKKYDDAP